MEKQYFLDYNDKKYILEYDLDSVMKMGDDGFDPEMLKSNTLRGTLMLFKGAFIKHHLSLYKDKDEQKIKDMWYAQKERQKIITVLSEMYSKVINDFFGIEEENEDSTEGN